MLAMVAEFEADLIRLRIREGMKVAKAKGRLRGKQPNSIRARKLASSPCTVPESTAPPSLPTSSAWHAPPSIAPSNATFDDKEAGRSLFTRRRSASRHVRRRIPLTVRHHPNCRPCPLLEDGSDEVRL